MLMNSARTGPTGVKVASMRSPALRRYWRVKEPDMTFMPASRARPISASLLASQAIEAAGVPSTSLPSARSVAAPFTESSTTTVARSKPGGTGTGGAGHVGALLGVVGEAHVEIGREVAAPLDDLEGGRHRGERGGGPLGGHPGAAQGGADGEAELVLEAGADQVRVAEARAARLLAALQEEAQHRLVHALLGLHRLRGEAHLPPRLALARGNIPGEEAQLHPVRLLAAQTLHPLGAGGGPLPGALPERVDRLVDAHGSPRRTSQRYERSATVPLIGSVASGSIRAL